jgi:hypothetical protein
LFDVIFEEEKSIKEKNIYQDIVINFVKRIDTEQLLDAEKALFNENIASYFREQGLYDIALERLKIMLSIREKLLGKEHPIPLEPTTISQLCIKTKGIIPRRWSGMKRHWQLARKCRARSIPTRNNLQQYRSCV